MSAFLNRLSGYNKNNVKMNVLGSSTANNGDVIQVDLPTNSIVDLSSLAWSFKNTISVAAAGNDQKHDLPIQAESIINRLAVEVNGQTLVNLTNYNVLFHALLYMSATMIISSSAKWRKPTHRQALLADHVSALPPTMQVAMLPRLRAST